MKHTLDKVLSEISVSLIKKATISLRCLLGNYAVLGSESTAKDKNNICDGQSDTTSSFVLRAPGYTPTGLPLCFKTTVPQNN